MEGPTVVRPLTVFKLDGMYTLEQRRRCPRRQSTIPINSAMCSMRMRCIAFFCSAAFALGALSPLDLFAQPPKDSLNRDYAAELPRIPPTEPATALKTFHVAPGFRIEQVAAEPLVADPVAVAFDENARLYVVEMRGYSENKDEHLSRIRLLEDTNGDGKFDKSSIFVDQLAWPTAIFCWASGVLVVDAPDIWYFKDTDGDGKA